MVQQPPKRSRIACVCASCKRCQCVAWVYVDDECPLVCAVVGPVTVMKEGPGGLSLPGSPIIGKNLTSYGGFRQRWSSLERISPRMERGAAREEVARSHETAVHRRRRRKASRQGTNTQRT